MPEQALRDQVAVVARTRLYQAEFDPAAAEEAERLRTWLARHGSRT